MKKLYFFLSLIGMFTLSVGLAQQKSVSGTILDETGGPLPGATVLVDGTNRGVTTDFDGNFSIQVSEGETLIVSYVGYADQSIPVGSQDSYSATLSPDNELEEVEVTALGIERESKSLGYSVSRVDTEIEYTCTGASTVETITIPVGTSRLLFTYNAGEWEGENLYTLTDPNGIVILNDGTGDGSMTNGPATGEQYNTCD